MTPRLGIGSTWTRPADDMLMVYVPAGKFMMGSVYSGSLAQDNEMPQHTVTLGAYWIDKTEVTNAMYAKCVQARVCDALFIPSSKSRKSYYGNPTYDAYPVINVTWDAAHSYCQWAGARLPSEAEWEKSARGTDGRTYPWGNAAPTCSLANYSGCSSDTTTVGHFPSGASPYGALDMAGNVWEWVNDWYDLRYYANSPSSNPQGPVSGSGHVVRGGAWCITAFFARSANRDWFYTWSDDTTIGFRCARSLP
jgi:eukaryotic-like serine/threonine-protein kinase